MAENNPVGVEDKDQRAATEATEQIKDEGQRTVGEGTAPLTTGSSPDVLTPVAVERSSTSCGESTPSASSSSIPRDERGKFKPKPNPEFTLSHFWLECFEICIGILMAQVIWEGGIWLMK